MLQSSFTLDSLKEQQGQYQANRFQIYRRQGSQETIGIKGCPYFCPHYRRYQEIQQVPSLYSCSPWDPSLLVRPNLTRFFGLIPNLDLIFRFNRDGFGPQVLKNGLNWVNLISKWVQIQVQDRHVLNKLDWTQFEPDWMGPQCPKLDQLGSSWPPGLLPKVYWALVNLWIMIHMLF